MTTVESVTRQVDEGFRPAQIARNLSQPISQISFYLGSAVLEGRIRWSDVLLTFPAEFRFEMGRHSMAALPTLPDDNLKVIAEFYDSVCSDLDVSDLRLFAFLQVNRVLWSDCYTLITSIECQLHSQVRACLQKRYPRPENAWWRRLPIVLRQELQSRSEADDRGAEPYSFTSLIDLRSVMEKKNWSLFSAKLPERAAGTLLEDLKALNGLRNRIMHPVRNEPPTDDEYRYLREMHRRLVLSQWRL